jgi:hypothetical protein
MKQWRGWDTGFHRAIVGFAAKAIRPDFGELSAAWGVRLQPIEMKFCSIDADIPFVFVRHRRCSVGCFDGRDS